MIAVRSEAATHFPPQADQPQAETSFATEGLLLAHRIDRNCGIRVELTLWLHGTTLQL